MARLNRFEATTAYPFLLNVYQNYETAELSEDDFVAILDIVETFLIRRFVFGVPTHGLSRIFISLYGQAMKFGSLLEGVKAVLKDKGFPRDKDFRERLVTFKLYGGGDRLPKAKLILERLELSFAHKEGLNPNLLTIEHVMPQTPTEWWKQQLGENWEITHEEWLDTVGNLTLTGYNPELSNLDFPAKKAILQKSHVELNRYFASVAAWNESAIVARGEGLADRALQIWPDFAASHAAPASSLTVDEEDQEDVKLLVGKVIEQLGGEVERIGGGNRRLYKVGDGKIINVKFSKRHGKGYYWFGIHASLIEEMDKAGATHMALIVGQHGFLNVPVAVVKDYLSEANASLTTTGVVRHYHAFIAAEPNLDFYYQGKPRRIPLKQYFTKFES